MDLDVRMKAVLLGAVFLIVSLVVSLTPICHSFLAPSAIHLLLFAT